ncbi:MAG: hypothetical protein J1E36_07120 [Eubacterium sp.]|nr:hypothetical protein [Eubacterium sp.]
MSKTLTEKKVLKKLGIDDFRHLTKDKVITMASMLDKMDPEVAKKAIEQFPDFSNTMKEILIEYKASIDKALESNDESVKSYYDSCDAIIATCQRELEKDNLSFDQRREVVDQMILVARMKGDKDSENKKFIATLVVAGLTAIGVVVSALGTALGGDTKIDIDEIKKIN